MLSPADRRRSIQPGVSGGGPLHRSIDAGRRQTGPATGNADTKTGRQVFKAGVEAARFEGLQTADGR